MNELGSRIIHEVQQQGVCIHISLCLFFLLQHSQESQESVACASPSARLHAQSRSRKEMASHIHTRRNREDRDGSSTPRLLWCGELHRLQASRRTQSTIRLESVSASSLLSLVVFARSVDRFLCRFRGVVPKAKHIPRAVEQLIWSLAPCSDSAQSKSGLTFPCGHESEPGREGGGERERETERERESESKQGVFSFLNIRGMLQPALKARNFTPSLPRAVRKSKGRKLEALTERRDASPSISLYMKASTKQSAMQLWL